MTKEVNAKKQTAKAKPGKTAGKITENLDAKKVKSKKSGKDAKKESEETFIDVEVSTSDDLDEYEDELSAVEESTEDSNSDEAWLSQDDLLNMPAPNSDEVILTDAEGRRYCRSRDCGQPATVDNYCRYHYLLLWKKIQVRRKILADGKLERYVEELTSRYPDKFLEVIRKDLRTEKDFLSAIQELEIDESVLDNYEEDDAQNYLDEVRGLSEATGVEEDEF